MILYECSPLNDLHKASGEATLARTRAVADGAEGTLRLAENARLGEDVLDGRDGGFRVLVDLLGTVEHVGEGAERDATNKALETSVCLRRGDGRRDNVLLGEDTLDDAGRATDRLKEARVRRDNVELRDNLKRIVVEDVEVELECEVR